jgi:hypothetical protein
LSEYRQRRERETVGLNAGSGSGIAYLMNGGKKGGFNTLSFSNKCMIE